MAAYPDRYHSIGLNWANIWADEMWEDSLENGIWTPNLINVTVAGRPKTIDLRTLVVSLDKQHKSKVAVYEFSSGRKFYE